MRNSEQGQSANFSEKRLERACQHVSDLWFPPNPDLVSKLRSGLDSGKYEDDIDSLLLEVRGDFSLYVYCLKEVIALLKKEGVSVPEQATPFELLRTAGLKNLKAILETDDNSISRHFYDGMSDYQRSRFEEAIVSASTSQVLAESSEIDPELGYSAALLRQLGLTLIAWNYPSVYQRALSMLKGSKPEDNVTLDSAISEVLGFSPTLLALTLARKWGLPTRLCEALDESIPDDEIDFEKVEEELESDAVGYLLQHLCKVGEALARANNPETYPTARTDWESARTEITRRLGDDGIRQVQEAITENCQAYLITTPDLFKAGTILELDQRLTDYERQALVDQNPYLDLCRAHINRKLLKLYDMLRERDEAEDCLRYLIKDVVPAAGFTAGCVYTIDPADQKLVPQLKLAKTVIRTASPVTYDPAKPPTDLIDLAYRSDEPIVQDQVHCGEAVFASYAGLVGRSQRIGVLYLEIPDPIYQGSEKHHLNHFRAFRCALEHCLKLA
ncbi:MAG: hypothetical protein DCC75_09510 [Proteobacteria bacterium]|nr:MAG: hypothetical protein DCC75_09510 [Pseudomonadota bacterium]